MTNSFCSPVMSRCWKRHVPGIKSWQCCHCQSPSKPEKADFTFKQSCFAMEMKKVIQNICIKDI